LTNRFAFGSSQAGKF